MFELEILKLLQEAADRSTSEERFDEITHKLCGACQASKSVEPIARVGREAFSFFLRDYMSQAKNNRTILTENSAKIMILSFCGERRKINDLLAPVNKHVLTLHRDHAAA